MRLDLRPGRLPQPGIDQLRPPRPHQLAPRLTAARPVAAPAAIAGLRYFFTVLRSTPRLAAISLRDRPACQWIKISVTSTALKLLLAAKAPVSLFRREPPSDREDHTTDATLAFPVGNYVSADLGNYVSDNRLNLRNYVSADRTVSFMRHLTPCTTTDASPGAWTVDHPWIRLSARVSYRRHLTTRTTRSVGIRGACDLDGKLGRRHQVGGARMA
jgi:hypothetical protein